MADLPNQICKAFPPPKLYLFFKCLKFLCRDDCHFDEQFDLSLKKYFLKSEFCRTDSIKMITGLWRDFYQQ